VLRKLGYSLAAMTIGLVLGGTFADNLHLTQAIYGWRFVTSSPLADVFLVISIALLVLITWRGRSGRAVITPERAARGPRSPHPVLEPVTEAVIAVVSLIYMLIALSYPAGAGTLPAIIAGLAAAVALFRLASHAVALLRDRSSGRTAEFAAVVPVADAALAAVPAGIDSGALDLATGLDARTGGTDSHQGSFGQSGDARPAAAADLADQPREHRRGRTVRELAALGWIWAAIAASYLLGFEVGVPLVAAAYALTSVEWNRRWQRLAYAVIVTGTAFGIAYCFMSLFNFTFSGLLT
jgi:hypothetical protein